ncbi:three component ABC system middle component [Bradyrhizobium sp. SZCCHNR1075]|uniref:three component ABC system middle component n=1 Tax=Bradyrhizobium sp. SZCCHNR1075 TaxID=3057362 RepID=UPI0028E6811C|nr:three component ABC system middle component [Bradyrhizobium sp. SZCCHNR1075]
MVEKAKLSELQIVQNPSLGSYLIWQYGLAFQEEESHRSSFLLAFLVLPLVLHKPTADLIVSTRKSSGLALFAAKLGSQYEDLIAVQHRALLLRDLSLRSIGIAASAGLVTIDYHGGFIRSNSPPKKPPILPERIRAMPAAAQKLGSWFSRMSVHQIASTLRVQF